MVPISPAGDAKKVYAEGPGLQPEGVVAGKVLFNQSENFLYYALHVYVDVYVYYFIEMGIPFLSTPPPARRIESLGNPSGSGGVMHRVFINIR